MEKKLHTIIVTVKFFGTREQAEEVATELHDSNIEGLYTEDELNLTSLEVAVQDV